MKYRVGNTGRVLLIKLDENEEVVTTLEALAEKERIRNGLFFIIGNIKKGSLVSGAETEDIPIVPLWTHFENNHEILGIGTIFHAEGQPKVHLHAALGRKDELLMGCLRETSKVFLLAEIVIVEFIGIDVVREKDPQTGLQMLRIY